MAKFVFKLQSYLNVKEKIEGQKKLEYGKAVQSLEQEKALKREMLQIEADNLNALRGEMEAGMTPVDFIRHKQFLIKLEKEIIKQDGAIKLAQNFAESKRIELLAAVKQRKMVDKLKEHAHETYLEEESKAEQKIVDEIVSYKYNN